jgi:D-inositol-3-phosphate glycosyltransferase
MKRTPRSLRRIAMLSVHTSPLALLGGEKTGGMNVYVRDFSRELARQGVAVDVFTRAQAVEQPEICEDLGDGVRVIHIPAGPVKPIPVDTVYSHLDEFSASVLAFAQAEGIRYDLMHSHYWLSGLVAERLRAAWGALPIVHMFHTLGHLKNRVARDEQERASQLRLHGERQVVQIADRLIAATPAEKRQLVKYYAADAGKISVIPPGVDLTRFTTMAKEQAKAKLGLAPGRSSILFAGRIEPLKGIDTLLEAAALLRQQRPDLMTNTGVTIIGGDLKTARQNSELTRLRALRCDLDLCDLVGFVGAKAQDILPYYFAAADMVVMPSHYESFGMVALEAMATGTPVIASGVGGLAHLVQDGQTGFHVPPRDPQTLALRMNQLLTNPDLRQQLGDQASAYARQYDWCNIVQRMVEEVYEPLVREEVKSWSKST